MPLSPPPAAAATRPRSTGGLAEQPPAAFFAGEDLWHAYNLIREGDHVEATTFRKVCDASGRWGADGEQARASCRWRWRVAAAA